MLLTRQVLLLICTFYYSITVAQKGTSADKPWVEELSFRDLTTSATNDTANGLRYRFNNIFGRWDLTVTGPSFLKQNERRTQNELKAIPFFLGLPSDVYSEMSRVNVLNLKAVDDEKNKFTGRFFYYDSIAEEYTERFLKKNENYHYHIFQKKAEGFIRTSTGDSIVFSMGLDYDDPGHLLNSGSYADLPGKYIKIVPLFNDNTKRNPQRGLYAGFRFYNNEQLVAEAVVGKGFMGAPAHRFWMSKSLSVGERQVIGALLFIIVYYY